jgi:hypothetical protein
VGSGTRPYGYRIDRATQKLVPTTPRRRLYARSSVYTCTNVSVPGK